MLGRDGGIGAFLFFVSILLCYGAVVLGIGKADNPGPGFFPFLAGAIIAVLSLAMVINSIREKSSVPAQEQPLITREAALMLSVLLLFGFLVEKAGFYLCTFGATLFMLRVNGQKRWSYLLLVTISICLGIFVVFNMLLEVRLPLGILRLRG